MQTLSGEKQGPAKNGDFASSLLRFGTSKHTTEQIFFFLLGRMTVNEQSKSHDFFDRWYIIVNSKVGAKMKNSGYGSTD